LEDSRLTKTVREEEKMANTEGMKMKFTVFKNEDLYNALQGEENEDLRDAFNTIINMIAMYRDANGKKKPNTYLVINTDEPYADEVIEIMKRHGHWG
jgi:hypothetical protein